jgi:hypothetical protein
MLFDCWSKADQNDNHNHYLMDIKLSFRAAADSINDYIKAEELANGQSVTGGKGKVRK